MDDEKAVRTVAGRMLKHLGYDDVEFAADGAEAVRMYKAAMESGNPFSVAILDLTVPAGMGGDVAVSKLLKIDPGVKSIVSSGYTDESAIVRYSEYGFSGMVTKPYTIEELGKVLRDVTG
jgi:CheY-like chemotaxis protein